MSAWMPNRDLAKSYCSAGLTDASGLARGLAHAGAAQRPSAPLTPVGARFE
jgi:hypothetical protein